MADDDSKLTRRRVLGGLATVGAAGAIGGAGTWAAFSDQEDSTGNSVQAGTRDLHIENGDSAVTTLSVGPVAPGDSGDDQSSLQNVGSLDGDLAAEITSVSSSGGSNPESEGQTASNDTGSGLEDELQVEVGFDDDGDLSTTGDQTTAIPMGYIATTSKQGSHTVASGGSSNLYIKYAVDSDAGNDAQGDEVTFDVRVYLE